MARIDGPGAVRRASARRVQVLGHRGASAELPENTTAAFARAVELGAHGVELDTHLSMDHVPVVRHDLLLDDRATFEMSAAELTGPRFGVPTLLAALDAVTEAGRRAGSTPWVLVEIKSAPDGHAPCAGPRDVVLAVGKVLAAHPIGARCVLESFDRAVLDAAAHLLPHVPRAVLADGPTTLPGSPWLGGATAPWSAPDPVDGARALGAVAVAVEHGRLDRTLADRAAEAGLEVWAWTVNDPGDAARAVALGASVLVTDVPGRMLHAVGQRQA